jgi:hypothetical protein
MAAVFPNRDPNSAEQQTPVTEPLSESDDALAAKATFAVPSASAAAVLITEPLDASELSTLLSQGVADDVEQARQAAGVA